LNKTKPLSRPILRDFPPACITMVNIFLIQMKDQLENKRDQQGIV
jgi:hypothetical protein